MVALFYHQITRFIKTFDKGLELQKKPIMEFIFTFTSQNGSYLTLPLVRQVIFNNITF